jgi:hypothetical protein
MKINTMIVLCLITLQLQAQTERPTQTSGSAQAAPSAPSIRPGKHFHPGHVLPRTIAHVIPTAFLKQK